MTRYIVTTESVRELLSSLPADIVITDPDITVGYARDQSRFTEYAPPAAVLTPRTTAEAAACLRGANRLNVPVIPRGAGSGLSGAANAVDGSVVLSLHRMNSILEIDSTNRLAVVQPGVITADLRAAASETGLSYPPDPGSIEFSTIGGNVATNAGGMCCIKYGVTGDFVIGLEVVLADGTILRTGRRTAKGVAGYDLTHLLVGSEGTLAVITEITVKLVPAQRPARTLVASFPRLPDAGRAVTGIAMSGQVPSMLEILDRTTTQAVDRISRMGMGEGVDALLLIQSDSPDEDQMLEAIEDICTANGATEVFASSDATEAAMLLEARRLALPALEQLGDWLLDDVAVPTTRIADLIADIEQIAATHSLTIGVFGHAGDGNLHPTIIYDESDDDSRARARAAFDAITARALDLGGTITGEHGVGRLKSGWLTIELGETAIAVHRSIKQCLDPRGILNPGSVLCAQ